VDALGRKDLLRDAALGVGTFAFSLAAMAHETRFEGERNLDVLGVVVAGIACLPLIARRFATLPVFVVSAAASSALYGLGYGLGPPVGFAVALYSLAEKRDEVGLRTSTAALVASAIVLLGPHLVRGEFVPQLLLGSVIWAAAFFAGERARLRRERLAELEERVAAEERTRIARDLHDSAGHAINVILVQAGAARLLQDRDPARARAALETIEDVARDTLGEIERLVGALRENGARTSVEPQPGLAALTTLAERHRSSGLGVEVSVEGTRRPLSSRVDQAAYRIVQEALTNAARHGNGRAEVRIAYEQTALAIAVTNPTLSRGTARDGGNGLIGMRERALLLGGDLAAAARDGIFCVQARIPYAGDE
jgi:signal transduction histidine kinase